MSMDDFNTGPVMQRRNRNLIKYGQSNRVEKSIPTNRITFFLVCALLLSQAYTIPFLAIGPSWAIWPTFSDLLVALLFISAIPLLGSLRLKEPHRSVLRLLIISFVVCFISYLVLNVGGLNDLEMTQGANFGLYGLYRLLQAIIVFGVVALLPLTDYRARILGKITAVVSFIVFISVFLTYFGLLQPAQIAPYLPSDLESAGPWYFYIFSVNKGLGTIGYNHAYVAAQVLLLLMLRLHLCSKPSNITNYILFASGIAACLLTGSRAGFIAVLLFALMITIRKPLLAFIVLSISAIFLISFSGYLVANDDLTTLIERQTAILDPIDKNNLSGRETIWEQGVEFLNEDPTRWITGIGFGSASDGPGNMHMIYLQIVLELGVFALLGFVLIMFAVLRRLYKTERQPRPVFWGTIALLLSSISQETFYPVAAMGVFLPFYMLVLSIGLRKNQSYPNLELN